ncbi:MAG: hypothetical protein Q8O42_13515 [Acidobacteriota bacterium]|nr:hypothetical protein [Acidobacteriota bacterium]
MNVRLAAAQALGAALLLSTIVPTTFPEAAVAVTPRATLTAAPPLFLPGNVDSNSPLVWDIEDGQRRLFAMTSHSGIPSIASGTALDRLGAPAEISLLPHPGHGVWMEAVVTDDVDTWYGFYHNEWPASRCGRDDRFVPRIGAARSTDRGRSWQDLGFVIQATQSSTACGSTNGYLIGGVGDLSVMLDANKQFLYIFYSQYQQQRESQGVAVARILWADRDRPAGKVELWRSSIWEPNAGSRELLPGLPGAMRRRLEWTYPAATPLVATSHAWHDADARVDAFWGPSVHWNTALEQYVMLLNRAKDENYGMEGVYVSFSPTLDNPATWSSPQKLLNGGKWYPQVVGSTLGTGTDKLAGASARFFMSGRSDWMINFFR